MKAAKFEFQINSRTSKRALRLAKESKHFKKQERKFQYCKEVC